MSTIILQPAGDDPYPHREDGYELDDTTISIELRWSERLQRWYATVRDPDGAVIVAGRAVNSDYELLWRNRDARLPPGIILPTSIDLDSTPPDFEGLGRRVLLRYISVADFDPVAVGTDAIAAEVV